MSNKRLFDIFNFKKPKSESVLMPEVENTDQDSDSTDNDLLSCSSAATSSDVISFSSEIDPDNNFTTSNNNKFVAHVNDVTDLGNLQSGPVRPILKVNKL